VKKESIGFMLGLFVLFGGYFALQNHYMQKQQNQPAHTSLPPPVQSQTIQQLPPLPPVPLKGTHNVVIKRSYANFEFTQKGGCLGNNILVGMQTHHNNPTPVSVIETHLLCKAYGFRVGSQDLRSQPADFALSPTNDALIVTQKTSALEITRTFRFAQENYTGDFSFVVKNISQAEQNTHVDFELGATSDNKNQGGLFSSHQPQLHGAALLTADDRLIRVSTPFEESPTAQTLLNESGSFLHWMMIDSLYWMNVVMPQTQTSVVFQVLRTGFNLRQNLESSVDQTQYEAWIKHPVHLAPGQELSFHYKVYIGPKNENILKNFSQYKLGETIDYGFFSIIARPMYHILSFLHGVIKNWGLAIILLTLLINIVFLPLQIKGYASAQKMQVIQPQLKLLQEKYKNDRQSLQRETMALMSQSGVNPLSGCLPLLPQIPVFFALDSCLRHTFELRQSPFFFWIYDLTQSDPYFVLPLVMAVLMIGYQKMIPMPSMDPTQAKLMKILPILFSVFMIFYPSGLALYVITNTVISMIRQAFLTRHYTKA
jgi:YidC/Oxa1 family membrane protein insertase